MDDFPTTSNDFVIGPKMSSSSLGCCQRNFSLYQKIYWFLVAFPTRHPCQRVNSHGPDSASIPIVAPINRPRPKRYVGGSDATWVVVKERRPFAGMGHQSNSRDQALATVITLQAVLPSTEDSYEVVGAHAAESPGSFSNGIPRRSRPSFRFIYTLSSPLGRGLPAA